MKKIYLEKIKIYFALIVMVTGFVSCYPTPMSFEESFKVTVAEQDTWVVSNVLVYSESNYYDGTNFEEKLRAEYKSCGEFVFNRSTSTAVYTFGSQLINFNWDFYQNTGSDSFKGSYLVAEYEDDEVVYNSYSPLFYFLSHYIDGSFAGSRRTNIEKYFRVVSVADNFIMLRVRIYQEGMIDVYLTPKLN